MDVLDFDYDLPRERIAQTAAEPRDRARLLVLDRGAGDRLHRHVADLPALLRPGDLLVVNDTRVVPARLIARKPTGGRVEVLLLEPHETPGHWHALLGASHAPRVGADLLLPGGWSACVVEGPGEGGRAVVAIRGTEPIEDLMQRHGRLPLPPYIHRDDDDPRHPADRERYQTVFASRDGALAAPTAGLHFTPELLEALERAGVMRTALTLHVGEGTFRAPNAERVADITLHHERFAIGEGTSVAIAAARARGARVVAVGTTVVRALESRPPRADGSPEPGSGTTALFIAPGHRFRYVDAMLTNFHLPQSTLLMLVCAFAGRASVLDAYAEAVRMEYRFFSYGDAMLIL